MNAFKIIFYPEDIIQVTLVERWPDPGNSLPVGLDSLTIPVEIGCIILVCKGIFILVPRNRCDKSGKSQFIPAAERCIVRAGAGKQGRHGYIDMYFRDVFCCRPTGYAGHIKPDDIMSSFRKGKGDIGIVADLSVVAEIPGELDLVVVKSGAVAVLAFGHKYDILPGAGSDGIKYGLLDPDKIIPVLCRGRMELHKHGQDADYSGNSGQ